METDTKAPNLVDIRWDNLDINRFILLSVSCNVIVKTITYPFVVSKTRIQVDAIPGEYASTFRTAKSIVQREGIKGLFSGLKPALVGFIFPQGAYIYAYEKVRDLTYKTIQNDPSIEGNAASDIFIANTAGGAVAALVATGLNTPLDVVAQRLQIQGSLKSEPRRYNYTSGMNAMYSIAKADGIKGLYRGFGASICLFVPSSAIWWAVYGMLRNTIYPHVRGKGKTLEVLSSVASGIMSGWAAIAILNPLDVAKTRLQTQDYHPDQPRNIFTMTMKILRNEGIMSTWMKGLTARLLGTSFFSAWTIVTYEYVKKWAYIDTSIPYIEGYDQKHQ